MLPVLVKDPESCPACGGACAVLGEFDVLGRGVWRWCSCVASQGSPGAGHPAYLALLMQMGLLHAAKAADYGTGEDALSNLRASEEVGVPAWKGAVLRMLDKVKRVKAFCQKGVLNNEPFEDALVDNAAYSLLALVLYREHVAREEARKRPVSSPPLLSGGVGEGPKADAPFRHQGDLSDPGRGSGASFEATTPMPQWFSDNPDMDAYLRAMRDAQDFVAAGGDGAHDGRDDRAWPG